MDNESAPRSSIRFEGVVTIGTIDDAHQTLLAALHAHDAIVVDCRAATDVDVSFIQLLLSARRTALGWGKTLALAAPADGALLEALTRGGFLSMEGADAGFWAGGSRDGGDRIRDGSPTEDTPKEGMG